MPFKDATGEFYFYIIEQGHVCLSYQKHRTNPVRICGPGDILGYGEIHFKCPHNARTLNNVSAWKFNYREFQEVLRRSPALQEAITKALCHILSLKDERILALEHHSIRNRVASLLISLEEKFGKPARQGTLLDVKIERETLAKLAGTVIESLSRQLSELEEDGLILREGRSIYITNHQKLLERSLS